MALVLGFVERIVIAMLICGAVVAVVGMLTGEKKK
jgi:hypothetical protein